MSDTATGAIRPQDQLPPIDPASGFPDAPHRQPAQQTEPHHSAQQPRDDAGRFTAEDIERARSEERAKLHRDMEQGARERSTLEERVVSMTELLERERADRDAAAAAETAAAAAEVRRREEENLAAPELINRVRKELESKFTEQILTLQQERDMERALREREAELAGIQQYATQAIRDNENDVAPQFRDFIRGTTREEIDTALALAKDKTIEILAEMQALQAQQQAAPPAPQIGLGVRSTLPPTGGPMEMADQNRPLSAEDIRKMSLSEYARHREQLIHARPGHGLYG